MDVWRKSYRLMNIFLSKASKTIIDLKNEMGLPVYIKRSLPSNLETVIRWGSIREANCQRELNSVKAIKLTSNKPLCRKVLSEHGIAVPALSENIFPCIGRTKYHTGGKGFWFCRSSYEVEQAKREGAYYFSHFYPKTREFRVHIGKLEGEYKVILYSEKEGDKYGTVIWNHDISNFNYRHIGRGERRLDIIDLAKSALKVTGLDFGAIDILADPLYPQLPQAVVCEINTAPSLSPLGIEKYCQYFERILEDDE